MDIVFDVGQKADIEVTTRPIPIIVDLFSIEPLSISKVITIESFYDYLVKFSLYLKKELEMSDKRLLDTVEAKFKSCLNFSLNGFERFHKIEIPLTLFLTYTNNDLRDISNHLFLQHYEKWDIFYNKAIQ